MGDYISKDICGNCLHAHLTNEDGIYYCNERDDLVNGGMLYDIIGCIIGLIFGMILYCLMNIDFK